jgi:hypothetical protein
MMSLQKWYLMLKFEIDEQSVLYENRRRTFANVMAIQSMDKRNPRKSTNARSKLISASSFLYKLLMHRAIDLQRFSKLIVTLCASSSGCDRNWSTFEFVSNL